MASSPETTRLEAVFGGWQPPPPVEVASLSLVKRWMAFFGWQGDPDMGFDWKRDADGKSIARHHDATWFADVLEAERLARKEAINHGR